jgi:tripartite-type tricarboxylate transporter receptor subunit TctC
VNATKLVRRRFLHLAAGTAALPAAMRLAWGQAYPTRPVRIIVGFPPGGATDITARLIGQSLSDQLGKPFIIENRSGASGNLAAEAVVNAAPDGYTLLLVNAGNVINSALYEKLNFNFLRDIAPAGSIVRLPLAMMVHPSVPATTVQEFIAYAKGKSGEISIASAGNGSSTHLSGEMFKMMTGVNMVHVPYRGEAPAITDLLGGQVQVMFVTLPASIEYIRAGRLRALAVTTAKRFEVLPNVPTVSESVPGFEASGWQGIGVPKNTPADIIDKLNKSINAALGDAKIKARFADLGGTVFEGSPADFGKFIVDETEKWAKVVKFSGAKAD